MTQYMLLLHESPGGFTSLSPEEMQRVIEKYNAWSATLASQGKLAGGDKLRDEGGRHVRRDRKSGGRVSVVDGPYTESKEIVGGYFKIEAADYDEAVRVARECPHMDFGWIEIREIEPTQGP